MSTQRHEVLMVGINLVEIGYEVDDETHEKFSKYMDEGSKELFCLYDGCNGEYILLGELIEYGDEFNGIGLNSLSMEEIRNISKNVKARILEEFDIESNPKIFCVTHWT